VKDAARPISTRGGTRLVRLVQGRGGGGRGRQLGLRGRASAQPALGARAWAGRRVWRPGPSAPSARTNRRAVGVRPRASRARCRGVLGSTRQSASHISLKVNRPLPPRAHRRPGSLRAPEGKAPARSRRAAAAPRSSHPWHLRTKWPGQRRAPGSLALPVKPPSAACDAPREARRAARRGVRGGKGGSGARTHARRGLELLARDAAERVVRAARCAVAHPRHYARRRGRVRSARCRGGPERQLRGGLDREQVRRGGGRRARGEPPQQRGVAWRGGRGAARGGWEDACGLLGREGVSVQ
jgi:hypothetical protein